jgi:hypothetical protein
MFIYYLRQILNIQRKHKTLRRILEKPSIQKVAKFVTEYILNAPFNFYIWVCNK